MKRVIKFDKHRKGVSSTSQPPQLCETTAQYSVVEIYLPLILWNKKSFSKFLLQLKHICPNLTIFNQAEGEWGGYVENVRVIRLCVEVSNAPLRRPAGVRKSVIEVCTRLLVNLEVDEGHKEAAIFFNDWPATGNTVSRLSP